MAAPATTPTRLPTPAWLAAGTAIATPVPSPDVSVHEAGDELVVMHRRSGESFRLNPTAAFVWASLPEVADTAELVDRLTEAYDVDAERASDDVLTLLSFWSAHRLLVDKSADGDDGPTLQLA